MNEALAQYPRHLGVDLGNHQIGRKSGGHGDVHGDPKAHPAEIVGRGDLDEGHVNRDLPRLKQPRDIGEVDGGEESTAPGKGLKDTGT